MEPPRNHMFSGVKVKEEVELEDGNVKLGKRRRTDASGSVVQLQQQMPDSLPVEDSTGKDPMNVLPSCAVQNSGQANGCSNEITKLQQICKAVGWGEPSYDFEEQGPEHMKIFKCKVTVHMVGLVDTILECFSDSKPKKEAAKEHAAQGVLWFFQRSGYINK